MYVTLWYYGTGLVFHAIAESSENRPVWNNSYPFRYMSSPVRLSVVGLSVTFVRHTQPVEIFGNVSTPYSTLAIRWHPGKNLRRSSLWDPSVGEGLNARGVATYSEGYISETVQDRR